MSTSAGLFKLPTEILLEVTSLLHDDHVNRGETGTPHPLVSFGLVCHELLPIGRKFIFERPTPLRASNIHSRFQSAPAVGGWVRTLTVDLAFIHCDDNDILASTMEHLPMMHDLTVVYEKHTVEERSEFIKAICNYQSLKKLKVKEGDLDLTQVPDGYGATPPGWNFPDYLINSIISSPCISLETLAHIASLALYPTVFAKVQAQAHFRTLVFRASVQFNLRDLFNSPTRWGCADTLTKLVIRTCSGTSCVVIAMHVAAGVFGNLKRLSVINSGCEDPQIAQGLVTSTPNWTIGVLDRLDLDHATDWEVAALSAVHVKELNMTRVHRKAITEALDLGGWPEAKVLRVDRLEDESVPGVPEFKQACETRNVLLEIGAVPYGTCHCHDG